jgi:outer membrane receptor protein involved in Fe transport
MSGRHDRPFLLVPLLVLSLVAQAFLSPPPASGQETKEKEKEKTGAVANVEVTVTAPRVEIPLKKNPAATTVVETPILKTMPRTIAIDEVMKLVPGVKVDNQADGERVHLSIRGEGILTERGTRGIKTLVEAFPSTTRPATSPISTISIGPASGGSRSCAGRRPRSTAAARPGASSTS